MIVETPADKEEQAALSIGFDDSNEAQAVFPTSRNTSGMVGLERTWQKKGSNSPTTRLPVFFKPNPLQSVAKMKVTLDGPQAGFRTGQNTSGTVGMERTCQKNDTPRPAFFKPNLLQSATKLKVTTQADVGPTVFCMGSASNSVTTTRPAFSKPLESEWIRFFNPNPLELAAKMKVKKREDMDPTVVHIGPDDRDEPGP